VQKPGFCGELPMRAISLQHITDYATYELKAVPFKPEFTGQMNFYLSVVDDKMKNPGDNRSIGLILCKSKKSLTVKYALDGVLSPIGVASYETALADSLPTDLKASLPSIEEIEAETTLYTEKAKLLGNKFNQMTYEDYIAQIAYDDEAKIFHGEVIGLNDVITFQGKSIEELQRAFKASVKDYLALCAESNPTISAASHRSTAEGCIGSNPTL